MEKNEEIWVKCPYCCQNLEVKIKNLTISLCNGECQCESEDSEIHIIETDEVNDEPLSETKLICEICNRPYEMGHFLITENIKCHLICLQRLEDKKQESLNQLWKEQQKNQQIAEERQ